MDSTVAAAWITGGVGALGIAGTVVTSWIGSRNTRKATERAIGASAATNRANLLADHERRLWERRADAYQQELTRLLHQRAQRNFDLRKYRVSEAEEKRLAEFYEKYELPGQFETWASLTAYASPMVLTAYDLSARAHSRVRARYNARAALRDDARLVVQAGNPDAAPSRDEMLRASEELDDALEAARDSDQALIDAIRNELRSKPDAALPGPEDLPEPRRRWLPWRRQAPPEAIEPDPVRYLPPSK